MARRKSPKRAREIKAEREANLLHPDILPAFNGCLSPDLTETAQEVLRLALNDRRSEVTRSAKNHYTPHATGAIVMAVTAFDVALTELILAGLPMRPVERRKPALKPGLDKFLFLSKLTRSSRLTKQVETLFELRHEIVHFLPHSRGGKVPRWFVALDEQGLFIKTRAPDEHDFQFVQKIPSYAAAYWAWQVIDPALQRINSRLPREAQWISDIILHNALRYRTIPSPLELAAYDKHYGLSLNA